jgi:ankyrin repeat protein
MLFHFSRPPSNCHCGSSPLFFSTIPAPLTNFQLQDVEHYFAFDHVLGPSARQGDVYNTAALPVVEDVLRGYNGTVFAYGQTAAGKTFTMEGPDMYSDELCGVTPRAIRHLFAGLAASPLQSDWTVSVTFLEIYLEKIRDLLDPSRTNLQVFENPEGGIHVPAASEVLVSNAHEALELLQEGISNRVLGSNRMNRASSRSHSIFMVHLAQKSVADGAVVTSCLYLVDLAGSEKVTKTEAEGLQLDEAKKINTSLLALGNVVNALTSGRSGHVPYRDSKLTRVLQESLGGNNRTAIIVACSPSSYNAQETFSTLRFASRAKTIRNRPHINQDLTLTEVTALLKQAEKEVARQRAEIKTLRSRHTSGASPHPTAAGQAPDLSDQRGPGPRPPPGMSAMTQDALAAALADAERVRSRCETLQDALDRVRHDSAAQLGVAQSVHRAEVLALRARLGASRREADALQRDSRALKDLLRVRRHAVRQVDGNSADDGDDGDRVEESEPEPDDAGAVALLAASVVSLGPIWAAIAARDVDALVKALAPGVTSEAACDTLATSPTAAAPTLASDDPGTPPTPESLTAVSLPTAAKNCGGPSPAAGREACVDDVDLRDAQGRTPLMVCAAQGLHVLGEVLLMHGADPCATDRRGRTPLHHTALGPPPSQPVPSPKPQQPALDAGRRAAPTSPPFSSAGEAAAIPGATTASHASPQQEPGYAPGETIARSVACDAPQLAALLIARGADVEATDDDGATPLCLAFRRCSGFPIAAVLVERGAASARGQTFCLLHDAARNGDVAWTALLDSSASPASQSLPPALLPHPLSGDSPLIAAARQGHVDVLLVLVAGLRKAAMSSGSRHSDQTTNETGSQLLSAESDETAVSTCLTSFLNLTSGLENITPLQAAAQAGHAEAVAVLIAAGATVPILLATSCIRRADSALLPVVLPAVLRHGPGDRDSERSALEPCDEPPVPAALEVVRAAFASPVLLLSLAATELTASALSSLGDAGVAAIVTAVCDPTTPLLDALISSALLAARLPSASAEHVARSLDSLISLLPASPLRPAEARDLLRPLMATVARALASSLPVVCTEAVVRAVLPRLAAVAGAAGARAGGLPPSLDAIIATGIDGVRLPPVPIHGVSALLPGQGLLYHLAAAADPAASAVPLLSCLCDVVGTPSVVSALFQLGPGAHRSPAQLMTARGVPLPAWLSPPSSPLSQESQTGDSRSSDAQDLSDDATLRGHAEDALQVALEAIENEILGFSDSAALKATLDSISPTLPASERCTAVTKPLPRTRQSAIDLCAALDAEPHRAAELLLWLDDAALPESADLARAATVALASGSAAWTDLLGLGLSVWGCHPRRRHHSPSAAPSVTTIL